MKSEESKTSKDLKMEIEAKKKTQTEEIYEMENLVIQMGIAEARFTNKI